MPCCFLRFTCICLEYSLRTYIAAPFAYFYRTLNLLLYKSLITFQQEELSQHKPCRAQMKFDGSSNSNYGGRGLAKGEFCCDVPFQITLFVRKSLNMPCWPWTASVLPRPPSSPCWCTPHKACGYTSLMLYQKPLKSAWNGSFNTLSFHIVKYIRVKCEHHQRRDELHESGDFIVIKYSDGTFIF